MEKMFEQASRKALRFETVEGSLSVEQLWKIQYSSKSGLRANLNDLLKSYADETARLAESNVKKIIPRIDDIDLKTAIVKHIITVREAEDVVAKENKAKAAKVKELKALLARKRAESMAALTEEQLEAMIAELNG